MVALEATIPSSNRVTAVSTDAVFRARFLRVGPTSRDRDLDEIDEVYASGMVSILVSSQPPRAEAHIVNPL